MPADTTAHHAIYDSTPSSGLSSSGRPGLTVMPPASTGWRSRFGFSQLMGSVFGHGRSTGSWASSPQALGEAPASTPAESVALCRALLSIQREFVLELADVTTTEAGILQCAIWRARSMRELWHLRTAVFKVVAVRHSQLEADRRLARLNRHFPTRTARLGPTGVTAESAQSAARRA